MTKTITVFGSSMPKPGEEEYETAYKLGRLLGENGYNVCTGGYGGIMDAVSKGASKQGQNAVGITVNMFSSNPSKYLTTEIKCNSLFERIEKLIGYGNGFIILSGGTGTMVELSVIWEMINKKLIEEKPVACHGAMWKGIIDTMDDRMKFEGRRYGLIYNSERIEDCANHVMNQLK